MGVMVTFDTTPEIASKPEFVEYAKNIAMQVAAIVPNYVSEAEVPADVVEHEKKILTEQVVDSGKPANVAEKIVEGRIEKILQRNLLA